MALRTPGKNTFDPVIGKIELHDATPAKPGEKHGPGGPTHCGNIQVDYEYQLEQWLIDLVVDQPEVVKVKAPDGRVWVRQNREFVAAPPEPPTTPVA
jgi:hypothetical protein